MKSVIIAFLFIFLILVSVSAQEELKVKSFLPSINDLTARIDIRKDGNGNPCALVKVVFADEGVTFECGNLASMIIGDASFHTNEYWVYMATGPYGAKHLKIKHPQYATLDVVFADYGFSTLEPQTTYTLIITKPYKESLFKPTRFYIGAEGHWGMMNSVGISLGGYLFNINIELVYHYGIGRSNEIYWNDNSSANGGIPYSYKYKPSYMGAKVGYGIDIGKHFCLTPQVGIGLISLRGKEIQKGDNNPNAQKGYAFDLLVGVRMDYLFSKHFGVMLAPEYNLAINKSNLFDRVADVSNQIKNFGTGFNVRVGIFATF